MESYREFCKRLPPAPGGVPDDLRKLFLPAAEPHDAGQVGDLERFDLWLQQPKASPGAFPQDARDIDTESGVWIFLCADAWRRRYDDRRRRAALGNAASVGLFTSGLVAVLGALGIDGELFESAVEWVIPGGVLGGRIAFPLGFQHAQQRAERARDLMKRISEHYLDS